MSYAFEVCKGSVSHVCDGAVIWLQKDFHVVEWLATLVWIQSLSFS